MRVAKRLAKDKVRMFEALAAYANMGDTPEDWKRFRLQYPDFFTSADFESIRGFPWEGFANLDQWMYTFAESWHKDFFSDPNLPKFALPLPPLLWYRNRLRSAWAMTDRHGYSLSVLLGFEQEAQRIGAEHPGEVASEPIMRPALVPSQRPLKEGSHGLPPGRPLINGVTGDIQWQFGCVIQQAVYELVKERWRARICPICGKYFVAMRTAQKLCSVKCAEDKARERALVYWNETGRKRRAEAK